MDADAIARLRLIRTRSIGPITYFQLIARFGSPQGAIDAIPDLARRGGGAAPAIASIAAIEREAEAVAAARAYYLILGRDPYPPLLAEMDRRRPL